MAVLFFKKPTIYGAARARLNVISCRLLLGIEQTPLEAASVLNQWEIAESIGWLNGFSAFQKANTWKMYATKTKP